MASIEFFLDQRRRALGHGDRSLYRAITADLNRLGYYDPEPDEEQPAKPKRKAREPRPKCEHGRIVGRCEDCKYEDE